MYDSETTAQKEKYEADLKKEIKKLQRYRDQIKTWIANSDIKDKTQLVDYRKLIESRMERFKVCEKETKTKAFSKEGLANAARQDPKELAKQEVRDWINGAVETLSQQIEEFEAEIEAIPVKRGKPTKPLLVEQFEESIERHNQHTRLLEQLIRLIDNESVVPEDVNDIKEMVEDYVERNQLDFDEFANPDDIYMALPFDLNEVFEAQAAGEMRLDEKVKASKEANKEKETKEESTKEKKKEKKSKKDKKKDLSPLDPMDELTMLVKSAPASSKPKSTPATSGPQSAAPVVSRLGGPQQQAQRRPGMPGAPLGGPGAGGPGPGMAGAPTSTPCWMIWLFQRPCHHLC